MDSFSGNDSTGEVDAFVTNETMLLHHMFTDTFTAEYSVTVILVGAMALTGVPVHSLVLSSLTLIFMKHCGFIVEQGKKPFDLCCMCTKNVARSKPMTSTTNRPSCTCRRHPTVDLSLS